ncbi:hypothetical protein HHK36_015176 [Tetracentron sinense]|uniref:RNase H type-1 domain-containing protein n=1 Tax=Tetracentron sinense TaxID=13715 RepID=A0A834Z5N0_TETSI|nr:hypothetical protein HHK36_015176 [Tetracentron sinense]
MPSQPLGPTMGMQQNNLTGEQQVVCHMALNCWNQFNHAYQVEEILQALAAMTITDPQDPEWILDTGASSHMTNNPGILNIVQPYMGSDKIIIDDGKQLSISHVGSASLPTSHGNLPLSNVLLVCDPSVSAYKGYSLPKEAEEHLVSCGLKNAIYSISAVDVKEDLFGTLMPCSFQQPASSKGKASKKDSPQKRSQEVLLSENVDVVGSTFISTNSQRKYAKLDQYVEAQAISSHCQSCILEFDGASKGNPGQAGAGAVLRADDGSLVCRLREGVGIATCNVAEYRAMLLGLKYALKKGFKQIRVQGDSKLVCMQVQGLWKTKNQNMADLCKEAKVLKDKFLSFQITHVLRLSVTSYSSTMVGYFHLQMGFNSEADVQANLAVNLADGEVQEECYKK